MNLEAFFVEIKKEIIRLLGDNDALEKMNDQLFEDHRVRTVFVYYLFSNKHMLKRFFWLSKRYLTIRVLWDQLHLTLLRIRRNSSYSPETIRVANLLLKRGFRHQSVCLHQSEQIIPEMEKRLLEIVKEQQQ